MNSNNNPDIDPSNNESLAGTLQFAFYKMLQSVNGMLPAKIIAYDRTTNRVQVQLLIAVVGTGGTQVSRPQVASLPVLLLGGGGFFISYNLQAGDLGWVLASDRDISLFLQTYSEAAPNTGRVKSFSDGLFIPNVMTGYTISPDDNDNAVLQNLDGTVKISFGAAVIKVTAPTVIVDSPVVELGNGTLSAVLNAAAAGIYNTHTHDVSGAVTLVPNQLMTSAEQTTNTQAS